MNQSRLENRIIAEIYMSAVRPESWQKVARLIAQYTYSQMCYLFLNRDQGVQQIIEFGVDPEIHDKYLHHKHGDIWLKMACEKNAPSTVRSDDLIPLEKYKKTEFFNEICVPANVAYMGGVVAAQNELDTIIYSCHRRESAGSFSEAEVLSMSKFARHFANATFLASTLQSQKNEIASLRSMLDRTRYGVVFCDRNGRIRWVNRKARHVFSKADGLKTNGGYISAVLHSEFNKLSEAIYAAALACPGRSNDFGSRLCIRRNCRKASYKLTILPGFQSWELSDIPEVVVFIFDPLAPPVTSIKSLKHFYGLTDAEVRVCSQISKGRTVSEIADRFSRSQNTIRTQLKSIFAKCDVSSQAQLMGLLGSLEY